MLIDVRFMGDRTYDNVVGFGLVAGSIALLGIFILMTPIVVTPGSNAAMPSLPTGSARFSLGHGKTAQSFVFSPDGKLLVAGDTRGGVHIWDWKAERLVKELSDHDQSVLAVAFDATGTRLASGDFDGKIVVYESPGFRRLGVLDGSNGPVASSKRSVMSLAFAPNSRLIAAVSGPHATVRAWDLSTMHPLRSFAIDDKIDGFGDDFEHVMLNSAGAVIALEGRGKIDQLDPNDLSLVRQKSCNSPSAVPSAVASRANALAIVAGDGLVTIWDADTLEPGPEIRPGPRVIGRLALSPDASMLALGFDGDSIKENGTLMVYEVKTRRARRLKLGTTHIHGLAFAPDGRFIAVSLVSGEIFVLPTNLGE